MGKKPISIFYINPEYRNYVPYGTLLRFEALYSGIKIPVRDFVIGVSLLILFLLVPTLLLLSAYQDDQQYKKYGVDAVALVTNCEAKYTGDGTQTTLSYSYEVNGDVFNSVETNSGNICNRFPAGTPIDIQYLSIRPTQSTVTEPALTLSLWSNIAFTFVMVIVWTVPASGLIASVANITVIGVRKSSMSC